jgi:DNA-binding response OmpR family regulator
MRLALVQAGYVVDRAATLEAARGVLNVAPYDIVILDIGLPDGSGLDLLRELRARKLHTPIILLTARSGLDDRIMGLDAGADDYLAKPFDPAELAARCRAILRRPGAALGAMIAFGDLALDTVNRSAQIRLQPLDLTPKEFALLEVLVRHQDVVVHRSQLENSIYSLDAQVSPNALDALASRLRRKLAVPGAREAIRTVHGVGYALTRTQEAGRDG